MMENGEQKKCPIDRGKLLICLEHCRNKKCFSCPNEKNLDCAKRLLNDSLSYIGWLEEQLGVTG